MCDLETAWIRRPWPTGGCWVRKKVSLILMKDTLVQIYFIYLFIFLWRFGLKRAMASSFMRFLDHTQRRTTVGRTPLDQWSGRLRDLSLTIHSTHNKQTSMLPAGFEPVISAGERSQHHALDRQYKVITTCNCSAVQDLHYLKKHIIFVSSSENMFPSHDGMARPEVAVGKTTSRYGG